MEALIEAVLRRVCIAFNKCRFGLSIFAIFLCFIFRIVSPIYGQQTPQVPPTPMAPALMPPQVTPTPKAQQTPQASPTPKVIFLYGLGQLQGVEQKAIEEGIRGALKDDVIAGSDQIRVVVIRDPATHKLSLSDSVAAKASIIIPRSAPEYSRANAALAFDAITSQKDYITALENQVRELQAEINALKEQLSKGGAPK